jgi:hypothetical protein
MRRMERRGRRGGSHRDDRGEDANSHADAGHEEGEEHGLGDRQHGDVALDDEGGAGGLGEGAEQIGTHACNVTNVVTDIVGDNRGVALVVLGKTLLYFAYKIGTNV